MAEPTASWHIRVYYEDTDAGGIVYHANYIRFAERARTEWLRQRGFEHGRLREDLKCMIVVKRMAVDFLASARLDDLLSVETKVSEMTPTRIRLNQSVIRAGQRLCDLEVELVIVGLNGRPVRIPKELKAVLNGPSEVLAT